MNWNVAEAPQKPFTFEMALIHLYLQGRKPPQDRVYMSLESCQEIFHLLVIANNVLIAFCVLHFTLENLICRE